MKKRKKLKNLLLNYFFLIIIFLCIFLLVLTLTSNFFIHRHSYKEYKKVAVDTYEKDIKLGKKQYTETEKHLMIRQTRKLANCVAYLIKNNKLDMIDKGLVDLLMGVTGKREQGGISSFAILNRDGYIIFDSNNKTVIGKNYDIFKKEFPVLYSEVKTALTKKESFSYYKYKNPSQKQLYNKCQVSIQIPETDLFVFTTHYESRYRARLISKMKKMKDKNFDLLEKITVKQFKISFFHTAAIVFLIFLILGIAACIIAKKLSEMISSPLKNIHEKLKNYKGGSFNIKIPESGSLEIATFIHAFNELGDNLNSYINELEKEIIARNRIESEIKIAQNIQKSMLPKPSNDFDCKNFSLYSKLIPAKNIAGDFYDYFFLDKEKNKLVFLIADVSGKGISAAFFMCIVKTIVQSICLSGKNEPKDILRKTNEMISKHNPECMFVTFFIVYYDVKSGNLSFANAGHHSTMHITNTQTIETFGELNNVVLGIYPEHEYFSGHKNIKKGETLVLYTDGITEAMSPDDEEYGEGRLRKILSENNSASPEILCNLVIEDTLKFQHNKIFDDMTILAIKRNK